MMKKSRKKHSAAFKAQVAIEAIKELETLSDLAKRFEVHPQMISNWKREFLARSSEIFDSKAPDEEAERREKALYEKIGRLEVEVDFCKRASEQLGIMRSSKK
jgi:transposase-like protein